MRQIFTSPRLENVERVAALLKEHGVEARITNGRSYKGAIRGHFTYRDNARTGPQPAVWIVRPDDQPKARELMREAGLLDSGRSPTSYLTTPVPLRTGADAADDATKRRVFLIKSALLIGIVFAAGIGLMAWRKPAPSAVLATAAAASTAAQPQTPADLTPGAAFEGSYLADVPSALAAMLLEAELRAHEAGEVCLSVDGADPTDTVLAQLQPADRARIRSRSTCAKAAEAGQAVAVQVSEYRTDGSGTGTVRIAIVDQDKKGQQRTESRTLEVKRDGLQWEVKRVVLP